MHAPSHRRRRWRLAAARVVPFHKSNDRVTIHATDTGRPSVTDFVNANFFRDRAVYDDPYAYFDWMRAQHPVRQEPNYGVLMITGYDEAMAVYHAPTTFSSCNTVAGPFVKFSVPVDGDDISAIIEQYRDELPFSDQL